MKKRRGSRCAALLLALLLALPVLPARAAEGGGYVLRGEARGDEYILSIDLRGVNGLGGRFAMTYDTGKVSLVGGDSFAALHPARGVTLAQDYVEQSELVNAGAGSVGFAWYAVSGVDAVGEDAGLVSLTFRVLDGDFDAGTFRVRHIGEDFGTWTSPLSLEARSPGVVPDSYAYLLPGTADIGVAFDYEGAEREPEAGSGVTLVCRDLTGAPVEGRLELNGRSYDTDAGGRLELKLLDGLYDYRLTADGYGPRLGVLEVAGDTEETITFYTDAMLVDQAAEELEIGFQAGDSAQAVRGAVRLPARTESGVDVAWQSGNISVLTHTGLVFRPEEDTSVTLTAALSRGGARGEKTFELTVLAKDKEPPAGSGGTGGGQNGPEGQPKPETKPAGEAPFTDLDSVPWAADAIEALARAGIIQGVGGDRFAPREEIRRCDFLLLVTRMLGTRGEAPGAEFDDVPPDAYYHSAVVQARGLGLVEGNGQNLFLPTSAITRQEMLTITHRALELTGYAPLDKAPAELSGYADGAQVAPWAAEAVGRLVAEGYIVGSENSCLMPLSHTTRAEAAVFLYRLYAVHG